MSRVNKCAAGVAVFYKKTVLLGKRIKIYNGFRVPYGGYWSIFGGSVEKGENSKECAARELEEETKLQVSMDNLIYIKTISDSLVDFSFYATELPYLINPTLNEEHTEFGWFSVNALHDFPGKIDSKILKCIDLYCGKQK
mgnify:CR=1 FL=1